MRGTSRAQGPKGSGSGPGAATASKCGDRGAADLLALVTAAKGLLQRTRVLSKRLNSLCAIHPQLMWELEEARRLRPEADVGAQIKEEPLEFPDPFELGTLEVIGLHSHSVCAVASFHPCTVVSLRIAPDDTVLLVSASLIRTVSHVLCGDQTTSTHRRDTRSHGVEVGRSTT